MPQVLIAVAQFALTAAVNLGIIGGYTLGQGAMIAIGGAIVAGGALVMKKVISLFEIEMPKVDTDRSRQATVRGTTEAHKVVYGESLVSGPVAFMGTAGTENRDLYYCIALAGHECQSITDIHFDNIVIPSSLIAATSTNAIDVGTTGAVSGGTFGPVGSPSTTIVQINKYLGTSTQDADILLRAAFPSKWTVDHDGKGIAYIVTKWNLNDDSAEIWDKYTPRDIKALVKGRKIYDPRLDTSPGANPANATYIAWSDNPALCLADYLINDDFGMGIAAAKIEWDAIVTAANACDVSVNVPGGTEKRFTCNGVVFGTDSHRTNINKILSSMNGNLSYVNGKYVARAGIWEAGTVQLTEDDLTAPVSVKTSLERSDRFNTIKGVFLDPASNYKTTEFPEVQLADAVTRDSDEVLSKEIALNMTNSSYMAQRIANKLIQLTDQQKVIIFPANMTALRVAVGDRVQVTLDELDWGNKDFQCVGWSFNEEGGVNLTLREDSDQSYNDPASGDYSQITSDGTIEDGFRGVPSPSALRGISSDDKVFLDWTNPGNPQDFETIHVFASSTNNFANAVKVGETDGSQFTVESNPGAGDASEFVENDVRYFWVRAIRFKGTSDQARSNIEPNNSTQGIEVTITSTSVSWDNVADPQVGITLDANDNIVTDLTDATASTTGAAVTTSGLETDITIVEGGLTINGGGAIRSIGKDSESDSDAGFFLGWNASANSGNGSYTFGVGNSTDYLKYIDGTLTVSGTLSGVDGDFSGTIAIGTGDNIFKADSNGIYLGNAAFASAPFSVTQAGALTATSATITGSIDASTSLTFNGANVTGSLQAGNIGSGQITPSKIALGAISEVNPVTITGNVNRWGGYDEDGTAVSVGTGITVQHNAGALEITNDNNRAIRSEGFEVDHNAIYVIRGSMKKNVALGRGYLGVTQSTSAIASDSDFGDNENAQTTPLTFDRWDKTRTAGTSTANAYLLEINSITTSYESFKVFLLGANVNIDDVPEHSPRAWTGFSSYPYVRLNASAKYAGLRILNWSNGATTTTLSVKDLSVLKMDSPTIVAENIYTENLAAINADLGAITAGTLKGGTIPDADAAPTNAESGSFFDLTGGKFVVGNATENLLFDGSNLSVTGEITATSLSLSGITIPKSDLESSVQTSLEAADSANQDSTATILGGTLTGTVDASATIGGTAASTVESGASAGATAVQDDTMFSAKIAWGYDEDAQGWTSTGITATHNDEGYMNLVSTSNDPIWRIENQSIDGAKDHIVRVRIKRTAGTSWQGALYYKTSGHGESESYTKYITDTTVANEWVILEYDMSNLTAGGTDWVDSIITGLRFDWGNSSTTFQVDWIAIGTIGSAALREGADVQSGTIGGINIDGSAIYSGSKSSYPSASTAGFILTSDGKIAISDGTQNVLSFDPTATEVNLNIQGSITAGSGSNTAALSGTEAYRFWAGSDNPALGTFRVDSQGQVVATNFILTDANNNILFSTADGFEPLAITQIAQGSGEAAKVTEYAESLTGDTDDIQITLSQTSNIQIKVRITCFWYGAEFAATDAAARTAAENELLQSVNLLVGYSATSGGAFTSSQNQSYTKVIDSATPTSTQINVETATSYDAESGTYLGTAVPLAGSGALNANKELIYTATFNNVAAGTYYVRSTVTATNDTATGSAGSASNNLKASNDSTYSRTVSIIDNTTDGGFTVDGGANQTVGGGDITSVSITANNGISGGGTVSSGAANFTLGLGAITPSSVSTTGTVTWDGGSSTNANTAFGWGDHSTAGYVTASSLSNYLPLAGGTLTGSLAGTSASFSSTISAASTIGNLNTSADIGQAMEYGSTGTTTLRFDSDNWRLYAGGDGGAAQVFTVNEGGNVDVNVGNFLVGGTTVIDSSRNLGNISQGTFTRNMNNTSGALSFDTSKSILGTIHIANGVGAAGQPKHAAITFQGDSASEAQAGIYVINDNSNGTAMALATTQSYATGPQIALEIDYNGNVDLKRGALEVGGTTVIDSSRNITATSVISGSVISGSGTPTGQLIGSVRSYGTTSAYMGASDESGRTAFFGVDTSGYAMFGALTNHDAVIRANNTEYLRVKTDSNVNVVSGGLQIGGTTVIDSSRNATLGSITGSSAYGGGTNDYTNVTTPPLKLVATGTSYIRVPHISQSTTISTVYNYEAGKNVYWGEPGDTGAYYFRGRTFFIENNSTDPILSFKTTSSTADPVIQMNGQAGITEEGFEIWYDNTVGDVHFHTTYDNAAAAIRFHTRTGASKSTSNERFAITGDGDIQVSGTTRISSSGSFYPANIQGTSKISFLNGGNALGIRVESLYAGTSYASDGSAAGTVDTLNGYRVGGTTVIDSSRNVGGANLSASGTLSVGNAGYVAGMQVGALELGTGTRDYNYTSGWSSSQQSGILANCSENWEFVIHDSNDALASPFAYFGSGSVGIGYFEMGRDLGWGAAEYYFRNGIRVFGKSANWSEVTPGTGVGTIHLSPIATDNYGSAITWGASDSSSGGTGQAGIYVRSDGSYGTKMYLATTDSYAAGSKVAISIQHTGIVALERNRLEVDAGGYAPDPTAKLYLSPSELQFGGNNNGKESNSGQISVGQHQANSLNFVGMSSGTASTDRRMDFWVEGGAYFRGNLVCTGNVTAYGSASDARLKTNVQKVIDPIAKLQAVNGYTFDWNENAPKDKQGQTEYGVIAQEVEAAGLEELVFEYERPVNETGGDDSPPEKWKAVHYEKFVPILIEAVKGQQEQIEQLKAMIEELKNGDN